MLITVCFSLLNGSFRSPRAGRHNDQAHPPIHPVAYVKPETLENDEQRRIYEFVIRHFLACCSEDAKGESTKVGIQYGDEFFHAHGLIVLERNYLDVYPYRKWESSRQLPEFVMGETFVPSEANIVEGKTTPPGYLTEPDLLGLMEANGIGTDATMAEHIAKIKERNYVVTQAASSTAASNSSENPDPAGSVRGRGRGRSRGSTNAGQRTGSRSASNAIQVFIPTTLGVALVEGYESVGFETSLSKPFLRKEVCVSSKRAHQNATLRCMTDGIKNEGHMRWYQDQERRCP